MFTNWRAMNMASYSSIRAKAREIAEQHETHPDVKALAELIVKLAGECEKTDKKAESTGRAT